jgi:hypothetical protein
MSADDKFKQAMTEWVGIKTQLASVRKDLSVLNQREKELREFVTKQMIHLEIDAVKVRDKVKVNLKRKKIKGSITKEVIMKGLVSYFHGDQIKAEEVFKHIQDAAPMKESNTVSITGLKDMMAS